MKTRTSPRKIVSKLYRLKMTDEIGRFLRSAPLSDVVETQVGNHVYSGRGKLKVGASYATATVRIRIVGGAATLYLSSPSSGVSVVCPFDARRACAAVRSAVRKALN